MRKSKVGQDNGVKAYSVGSENMSLEEKEEFLNEIGQGDLIKIFDNWQPNNSPAKRARARKSKPLDQKMTLTVSKEDRKSFEGFLKELQNDGEEVSMSTVVRNRSLSHPDIEEWKTEAIKALKELKKTAENKKEYKNRIEELNNLISDEKDKDALTIYYEERNDLDNKLSRLSSTPAKRTQRLSGRMTFEESETIKWRASRLCISTSDYLRMMIFDLKPNGEADKHMSLIARQRFYVAIGEISRNGWGTPPRISECTHCVELNEEIEKLELENAQLKTIFEGQ